MAAPRRSSHRLILGLFCGVVLLGAYGDRDGAGGAPEQVSLRPETPPAGGAGGNGNVCEAEFRKCPNSPAFCPCGYVCPDEECLPAPPHCEFDTDCPSGACQAGKCRCADGAGFDQCNPQVPDKHTYMCGVEGFCLQLPDQCDPEGSPCGDDGVCRRSQCYERCSSDLECPAGLVCKQDRFCGPTLVPDGLPPAYSCATRGGEGLREAWLFVLVAIAAGIRARSRR